MKLRYIFVFFIWSYTFYVITSGNIVRNVHLIGHVNYMINVATETVKQVETREWCNLKVPDAAPIGIDDIVLGWHAKGDVRYKNGFVVSIQGIDLLQSSVNQVVNLTTTQEAQAIVTGTLRMHDVAMGYDVDANMDDGVHHYTAKYVYPMINMQFVIVKIIDSDSITVNVIGTLPASSRTPTFLPSDRLSDTLTTLFDPNMSQQSIIAWATDVFKPIAETVITTQVQFPALCYNCAA